MIEKELKIRDFCGDYALDIPFADGSVNTIYFNSKRNAETVKHIIEVDGSKPNHATVCEMEEIRHGKWEYDSGDVGYAIYLCSECGNFIALYAGVFSEGIERIKSMSIDEMARSCIDFFSCPYGTPYVGCPMEKRFNDSCIDCTKHWLESEVEE